jgi:hypothetical protein
MFSPGLESDPKDLVTLKLQRSSLFQHGIRGKMKMTSIPVKSTPSRIVAMFSPRSWEKLSHPIAFTGEAGSLHYAEPFSKLSGLCGFNAAKTGRTEDRQSIMPAVQLSAELHGGRSF